MNTDVVIIGAGPSGSLAAAMLQKAGWKVMMLEKSIFPRFVIGESLLPRCMESLEAAGLLETVERQGFQKKIGARFYRNGQICDFNFSQQFTAGYGWTWQVPRAEFDKALADEVAERGVDVRYGCSVNDIEFGTGQQLVSYTDGDNMSHSVSCKFIIDGSGYGRVIPRLLDLDMPSDFPPRAALFAHVKFDAQSAESRRIDIVTVDKDVWAWIIPFADGRASVGFVGDIKAFENSSSEEENGALLRKFIASNSYIADKLGELQFTMSPRKISAYSVAVKQFCGQGYVLTGNSTEFLDPVFSSGVTFAMESAVKAAELVDKQLNGDLVDWEQDYVKYIQRGVDTFRSYVEGWYNGNLPNIFFSPESLQQFKEQICSVLAGYVWDTSNPFVRKHKTIISTLSKVLEIQMSEEKVNQA